MIALDKITDYPHQKFTLLGENKEEISFVLHYLASQQCWMMNLSYGKTVIKGMPLVIGGNILRQWRNVLPFGLMVRSVDGQDPYYLDDFSKGRISIYLLNSADVKQIEGAYN